MSQNQEFLAKELLKNGWFHCVPCTVGTDLVCHELSQLPGFEGPVLLTLLIERKPGSLEKSTRPKAVG